MNPGNDDIDALLSAGAPRPEPPADVRARVQAHVDAAWQARNRRRRQGYLALAAGVLIAASAVLLLPTQQAGFDLQVASAEALWLDGRKVRTGPLHVPDKGTLVADGTSTLRLPSGAEMRLRGGGTRVHWRTADTLDLEAGEVFVRSNGGKLALHTPFATFRNTGTVFRVAVQTDHALLAMREGAVQVESVHGSTTARARQSTGDVVVVDRHRVHTTPAALDAPGWSWSADQPTGYAQAVVGDVLAAVARDLHKPLLFASPEAARRASEATVTGDLSGASATSALAIALGIAGLEQDSERQDAIVVRLSGGEARD
jgi:ferric-dicitrate binding protein FerR (iron transport regulator)